jgi:hypothetical protein
MSRRPWTRSITTDHRCFRRLGDGDQQRRTLARRAASVARQGDLDASSPWSVWAGGPPVGSEVKSHRHHLWHQTDRRAAPQSVFVPATTLSANIYSAIIFSLPGTVLDRDRERLVDKVAEDSGALPEEPRPVHCGRPRPAPTRPAWVLGPAGERPPAETAERLGRAAIHRPGLVRQARAIAKSWQRYGNGQQPWEISAAAVRMSLKPVDVGSGRDGTSCIGEQYQGWCRPGRPSPLPRVTRPRFGLPGAPGSSRRRQNNPLSIR